MSFLLTSNRPYAILKIQRTACAIILTQVILMTSISTGDRFLDSVILALTERCRVPERISISICSDTTPCIADADHVIVIASDVNYTQGTRHREYSALYKDNYHVLFRPFSFSSFEEILESIKSSKAHTPARHTKKLKYDPASRRVSMGGAHVTLSTKEGELFEFLLAQNGRPVSREELRREIWPDTDGTNAPDVYITYLRQKLKGILGEGVIVNLRGEGYLFKY